MAENYTTISETQKGLTQLKNYTDTELGKKQDILTAGTGIAISGNVISSTGTVAVDSALSSTSENPVQNKVIDAALQGKANATALEDYVRKETGKGLSTNDFTDADKTKLDDLAEIKSIGAGLNLSGEGVLSVEDPSEGVTYSFDYVKKENKWYTTLSDGTTTQELAVPEEWYQGGGGSIADLFDYALTNPVDMEGAHDIAAFMSRYLNLPGMATGIGTSRLGYKVPTLTTSAYTWVDGADEQTATADVTITFADGSTLVKTLDFRTVKNRWVNAAKGVDGGYIDTGLTLDYSYTLFYEGCQPAGASGAPIGAFTSTAVRTTARLMGNANKMQCMWPGNTEFTSAATGINFNEPHTAIFNANGVELTQGSTTYTGALSGTSSGTDSAHILIFNEEASSSQRNAVVQKAGVRSGADTLREIVMAEINGEIVGVDIANLTQVEQDEIISEAYASVNANRIYRPVVGTLEEVTV